MSNPGGIKPDVAAVIYGQLADVAEVKISIIARERDLWRRLSVLFTAVEPPFPPIVPPPVAESDPDFEDVPGQSEGMP